MPTDRRGNPVSTSSEEAVAASERALWRMMSFYDTPLADLDAAAAADPAWCLPHAMKAGFLAGLTEPGLLGEARRHLRAATVRLGADAAHREHAHVAAVAAAIAGDWQGAADRWAVVSTAHPRDALALQWGHLFDFHRGDAASLESRIAAALPAWPADDPWRPHVQAMHAFGLEERGRFDAAEAEARAALAVEPRAPWAIHAVAHCMEMQGRFDEGRAWLTERRAAWGEGDNGFSGHLGWHEALFALETFDVETALAACDRYLAVDAFEITLQRLDAASILWRLSLWDVDVRARLAAVVASWPLEAARDAGHSTFNDLHVVLALLGSGDLDGARRWVEAAHAGASTQAWNRIVMRDVGGSLLDGLVAFGEGRHEAAVDALLAAMPGLARIGGSHAQRDVIAQTLLVAAVRAGRSSLARSLADERRRDKATPLNAAFMERSAH